MIKKWYCVELYDGGQTGAALLGDWAFLTKAEQLSKYYSLIVDGYKRNQIDKYTTELYL